mmetsp:Transcript_25271/g.54930  ORF Transcript_25271/g.54930 Transcript_25271/m.54930 type:complete len:217 (-) Transcript_25271:503-1153(-)|eukprot:CAMPEP_0202890216 /NCGR_PEP_ID=MMETSP1392-20130828/713_1 /ASSEMBLY_ACC=CAM_ASM_000868 /TAXON_ID=225041 /ORGANISM="Chlamydomonas chlamydogama, Strain SAG 11-48b" /LENGTH=216 /DNA_ID=CAMNT_0049573753 /DNA_START=53 /DNA_END=703 /DNA_ORIENTATION=+
MPRGNPNVWNFHGQSYAELSKESRTQTSANAVASSSGRDATVAQLRSMPAAGTPSSQAPRGAGSFASQTTWSLGDSNKGASKATEARTQFRPPPEDYKCGVPLKTESQFPVPNYPHEFKTSMQADYSPEVLQQAQRTRAVKHKDSGRLLPQDVPPQYTPVSKETFVGHTTAQARAGPKAGFPATQNPGYNIITGGPALNNNVFERFQGSTDYRRHR